MQPARKKELRSFRPRTASRGRSYDASRVIHSQCLERPSTAVKCPLKIEIREKKPKLAAQAPPKKPRPQPVCLVLQGPTSAQRAGKWRLYRTCKFARLSLVELVSPKARREQSLHVKGIASFSGRSG